MVDVHQEAHRRIIQCLVAALIARPLDPAITDDELQELVVASGISIAVYKEVATQARYGRGATPGKRLLGSGDLILMLAIGDGHYPVTLFPRAPIVALRSAFNELDREYGKTYPKALSVLISKCAPETPEAVELALGMAVALGLARKSGDGYLLDSDLDDLLAEPHRPEPHPWVSQIRSLVPMVENILARRSGALIPSLSPLERFHRFLAKQNWTELASWWALTSREMESASRHHPTSATVLAGALLEAAFVAIAEPAMADGQWQQKFLNDPPESWKLGKLIDQAGVAGTLGGSDLALARNLAELRNRIHAGKYSTAGKGPFRPPSINEHEAELARLNLLRVVDTILGWGPVIKRT